ncbi:MAG: hypothetical protein GC187_12595 [Alphaproteobacteria bacterium]|nr:hypothetical protein [Alphaproteobacteria bacterium]
MMTLLKPIAVAALAAAALLAAPASAQYVGGNLQLDLDDSGDVSIAGANVRLTGRVGGSVSVASADFFSSAGIGGDLEMAAANVTVTGPVQGDVTGIAANITLDAPVGGDFDAAGANITLLDIVAGEMSARGALITIGRDARIEGEADLSAREIILEGALGRGGKFAARDIRISGAVDGPLDIAAERVEITATAVITGPVTVRAPNPPRVAEGAVVGEITYVEAPFIEERHARHDVSLDFMPSPWAIGGVLGASAFILGFLASVIAPRGVAGVALAFRRRPWVSGFLGLVVLAMSPVLIVTLGVLLVVTIIGIPLALLLLLAAPILYFLAFAFGGVVIGDAILNRSGGRAGLGLRLGSLLAAILAIIALSAVPVLGFIVLPLVLCIGLGAWTLAIFGRESLKGLEAGAGGAI